MLRQRFDELSPPSTGGVLGRAARAIGLGGGGGGGVELARELYSVASVLVGQPRLRRNLSDPTIDPARRRQVVTRLLEGKVSDTTLDLTATAAEQRWSSSWDLSDSLERLADDALLGAAENSGQLDEVEDELFRFERILDGQPRLTTLLDEATVPAERRVQLVRTLLDGRASQITELLVEHAVESSRKRSVETAIDELLETAAARRERSIARVVSAVELTPEQESRIAATLGTMYGREISVRTEIDPAIRGGLVIRIGDEVIDGSVTSRFAAVRKALAG